MDTSERKICLGKILILKVVVNQFIEEVESARPNSDLT